MKNKYIWIALGSLALLVLAWLMLSWNPKPKLVYNGSLISPPVPAGAFNLTFQDGKTISLSDLHGQYLLVFFGFTNCTNECPATMAILSQVRRDLGDKASQVRIVLITTDPARDDPAAMQDFVGRFDPQAIGLTGSLQELTPVWKAYGVTVLDNGETHSTIVYLVDPQGDLRLTYSSVDNPDPITADLTHLMQGD